VPRPYRAHAACSRRACVVDEPNESESELIAAIEHRLAQLEMRAKQKGKHLRAEIREDKRRLDAQLEQLDEQSGEAWSDAKQGVANPL
jgi:hypothetical protein